MQKFNMKLSLLIFALLICEGDSFNSESLQKPCSRLTANLSEVLTML